MPIYEYACENCGLIKEEFHSVNDTPKISECLICRGISKKIISQSTFILNGPGWTGRDFKIASEKRRRYHEMGKRQENTYGEEARKVNRVVPNVGGELCDTWKEAGKLAREKKKDTSSYERMSKEAGEE